MTGSLVGYSHVFVLGFKQQLLQQLEVHPSLEKVTPAIEGRVLKKSF